MSSQALLESLNCVLKRCKNTAFYSSRIPEEPIQSIEEFKRIPLTTKADLRRASPFGLIAVSRSRLFQYHESFGTTGIPVSSWFTRKDIEDVNRVFQSWGVGISPEDIVLIRYPYAISSPAHLFHRAAQAQGACVIPASSRSTVSPFPRIIDLLRKLEVSVLAGLPLQMILIAETAELLGFNPRDDFPHLRAICTAGEALPEPRRELIEQIWGKPVYDHYGMTECGPLILDCKYQTPHHQEEFFYYEILADDLQRDVKPGEPGYLTVTTLRRQGSPLIRYLTGDRVRLLDKDCACGRKNTFQVCGRQEDLIKVNGRILDRTDLELIVAELPCRRFWAAGPSKEGINLVVEREKDTDRIELQQIQDLSEKYQSRLDIELLPKGSLYDRSELLAVGVVGKPQYIYTAEEMKQKAYLKSVRT